MKNKVLKNSFWLIYDKVFRLLGIVIFNLLLANNLGADFVGEYHFIIAVSYIFYAISLFGLNDILIKELVGLNFIKYPDMSFSIMFLSSPPSKSNLPFFIPSEFSNVISFISEINRSSGKLPISRLDFIESLRDIFRPLI